MTTGERVSAQRVLHGLPGDRRVDVHDAVVRAAGRHDRGERASAVELALEGLYLARRISKDSADGETVYG